MSGFFEDDEDRAAVQLAFDLGELGTTAPASCQVHGDHRPAPLMLHVHHLQPLGMGGPDEPANKVTICPTGHFNVHTVLAALVFDKPLPKAARREAELARQGYAAWVRAGKPGNAHAAYGLAHPPGQPVV